MARKPTPSTRNSPNIKPLKSAPARPASPISSTPVRNTALPKSPVAPVKREITHELIAKRAYEIHISGTGGSQDDDWQRAERELRGV